MSQALALSSILGFAALFAAIWIMHRPLNVHSCPRAGVRAAHRVLEWALVAYAVVLMRKTESPTSIRRVEIYRDAAACQAHLATPRFRAYQEGTQHMIKSLEFVTMQPLDAGDVSRMFRRKP